MKRFLLFVISAVIVSSVTHAQIDKGSVLLGGSIDLNGDKFESTIPNSNKDKTTIFGITPSIGVAIKPNTIIGIQLGYTHRKYSSEPNSGTEKYESYRAEAFLRKYMGLGKGFYLFAQPGVYFNNSIQEYESSNTEQTGKSKGWSVGVNLYPGISYAVNKRFHLEAGLGDLANLYYYQSKTESKSNPAGATTKSTSSRFSFSSSLSTNTSISIGFRFFLTKRDS